MSSSSLRMSEWKWMTVFVLEESGVWTVQCTVRCLYKRVRGSKPSKTKETSNSKRSLGNRTGKDLRVQFETTKNSPSLDFHLGLLLDILATLAASSLIPLTS